MCGRPFTKVTEGSILCSTILFSNLADHLFSKWHLWIAHLSKLCLSYLETNLLLCSGDRAITVFPGNSLGWGMLWNSAFSRHIQTQFRLGTRYPVQMGRYLPHAICLTSNSYREVLFGHCGNIMCRLLILLWEIPEGMVPGKARV